MIEGEGRRERKRGGREAEREHNYERRDEQ